MKLRSILRSIYRKSGVTKLRDETQMCISGACLKKNGKKIKGTGVIHVAFFVYEPTMWDKQLPIYNEMLKRENFQPVLIVIPDMSIPEVEREKKMQFFFEKHPNVKLYSKETLTEFQTGVYHYTFYQTPYPMKYPREIHPSRIVRYSKICYIPYGYVGSPAFFETVSDVKFFSNVYMAFMDNEETLALLEEKFKNKKSRKYQHFLFLGYPSFEFYLNMPDNHGKIERVLWLPRWSYAEEGGGSHFIEYKDNVVSMAREYPSVDWAIRPHPLMFPTLLRQGLLTEEALDAYKAELTDAKITLDEFSLLDDTLGRTDLMIADYSSVLVMYLLSGRPIIYCEGNLKFSGIYQQMKDAMYFAKNWQEVESCVQALMNGNDPLKEKRKEVVAMLGEKHKTATNSIVDAITKDYLQK